MSSEEQTQIRSAVTDPMVGLQLSGIYELDEHIASGGMGEVYRGHNIQTLDVVAIKLMRPEFARDQTMLGLFRKEASILNHLSHDAIVRYHVFTIDQASGRPYLAMEFVRGISLLELMRRGPLPAQVVRRLCHRLASGLSAVHDAGAVHRDLSPDNVILLDGRAERAKIIDFGIAKSATLGGQTLIGDSFAGKYSYVSPEQLGLYGGEVTQRSDIYSLGLILAAARLGKPLDMGGSPLEVLQKRRTVPDLSGLDGALRPVVEAMLQPDPQDRPASMAEIAWTTRETTLSDTAQPSGPLAPAQPSVRETSPAAVRDDPDFVPHVPPAHLSRPRPSAPEPAPPARLTARRRSGHGSALLLGALTAIAAAAGLGAYYLSASNEPPEASPPIQAVAQPDADASAAEPVDNSSEAAASPSATQVGNTLPPFRGDAEQAAAQRSNPPSRDSRAPDQPGPAAGQLLAAPDRGSQTAESGDSAYPNGPGSGSAEQLVGRHPSQAANRDENLAMNMPRPTMRPADAVDDAAKRISWLRGYEGGHCFYATATAMTDKVSTIEGFGTSVAPFERLLAAFEAEFGLEPDINVRLIEPPQCDVVDFLRELDAVAPERPALGLERTVIPQGASLSGTLGNANGSRMILLLVDNEGMTFDVTERVRRGAGQESFTIPLPLRTGTGAAGPAPHILVAISAGEQVRAATLTKPEPAAVVFRAISAEIEERGIEASATAKYFRFGG